MLALAGLCLLVLVLVAYNALKLCHIRFIVVGHRGMSPKGVENFIESLKRSKSWSSLFRVGHCLVKDSQFIVSHDDNLNV